MSKPIGPSYFSQSADVGATYSGAPGSNDPRSTSRCSNW